MYMQLPRSTLSAAFLLALVPIQPQAQTKGDPMSAVANDQAVTIHRFYEQCINLHHSEILPELLTPGVIIHSSTGDATGLAAVGQTVERVHAMFPDHHFTVNDVVVSGDKAAARWTMTATNTAPIAGVPPTGRPITQHAVVFYRFEGNKIAEAWLQMDQLGVLRQIGVQIPGVQIPNAPSAAPAHSAQQ
jgi:predicted ester cyclase